MAGIAFQIFAMLVFGALASDYYVNRKKAMKKQRGESGKETIPDNSERPQTYAESARSIHIFYCAISFAYATILIRCIYRIHEMAGGWGNPRMREEPLFLILDGMMIALASIAMTVAHPGFLFPPLRKGEAVTSPL